ncbi:hypothetical protein ASD12_22680 [Mesorhizobium sp. Root102]|nr:hypothetical protein ASD12_22680 [Mesorhizobium sp. Root102]
MIGNSMSIKLPLAAMASCLLACRSVNPRLSWETPTKQPPCSAVYGGSRRTCLRICMAGGGDCPRKTII